LSALAKLQSFKVNADKVQVDRDNYAAYIESMSEYGWTDEDVAAYRAEVERIMAHGTTDEKEAARTFWTGCAPKSNKGINERIRAGIAQVKAEQKVAA